MNIFKKLSKKKLVLELNWALQFINQNHLVVKYAKFRLDRIKKLLKNGK